MKMGRRKLDKYMNKWEKNFFYLNKFPTPQFLTHLILISNKKKFILKISNFISLFMVKVVVYFCCCTI